MSTRAIRIPILNTKDDFEIFPDELPINEGDYDDLIDILRAELAPLKVWRSCAVEFYRQGFFLEFDNLLAEIVENLGDPLVEKIYNQHADYSERLAEIFDALAASSLKKLSLMKENNIIDSSSDDVAKKVVEYLRKSEEKKAVSENTWIIKGFYELHRGENKRAESQFRIVYDRTIKDPKKTHFHYLSLLGLAIVANIQEKYELSLDYLCKAVLLYPNKNAFIRVGIALLCMQLKEFERAQFAIERALELDEGNVNCLILLGLIELVKARKDKIHRLDCNVASFEYFTLALLLEPKNPLVLNHVANHLLNNWTSYGKCIPISSNSIRIFGIHKCMIMENDIIRVTEKLESRVTNVSIYNSIDCYVDVSLSDYLPNDVTEFNCYVLELSKINGYLQSSLEYPTNAHTRSESYYLLGKLNHIQNNIDLAFAYYKESLKVYPDMWLSQFEAAKILFSREEFASSLEIFERIKKKFPEDKDTQGFILLIKSILQNEMFPVDVIREINNSFQFNIDLWVFQAVVRQKQGIDYATALKCYNSAVDIINRDSKPSFTSPVIFNNIGVLHHSMLNFELSLTNFKKAIIECNKQSGGIHVANLNVKNFEFEDLLFSWELVPIVVDYTGSNCEFISLYGNSIDIYLAVGDEITVDDIILKIEVISGSSMKCNSTLLHLIERGNYQIRKRVAKICLSAENLVIFYNFCRLLEDNGKYDAAIELYVGILKIFPSYIECYLRLAVIHDFLGKYEEGSLWISRGLTFDDNNIDILNYYGDHYYKLGQLETAKKYYTRVIKNMKDARSLVALGNCSVSIQKSQSNNDSYKFFYQALQIDKKNVFAANGLGISCAENSKFDTAREIFAKIRECDIVRGETTVSCNVGNILLAQKRYLDAIHIFQAKLRFDIKLIASDLNETYDCLAFSEYKNLKFDDALKTIAKSIHRYPFSMKAWYNLSVVKKSKWMMFKFSENVNKAVLHSAHKDLQLVLTILKFFISESVQISNSKQLTINQDSCKASLKLLEEFVEMNSTKRKFDVTSSDSFSDKRSRF